MQLTIIVAAAENGVIGHQGDLPWHLSADLRRFKQTTMGHAILMGRKTWESIGRPLPGRISIVLTRQSNYDPGHADVLVAKNLDDALALARNLEDSRDEAFVIGGARIYEMSLPRAERLLMTRVHAELDGDVWLPEIDWEAWQLVDKQSHEADDQNDHPHTYQTWHRKS